MIRQLARVRLRALFFIGAFSALCVVVLLIAAQHDDAAIIFEKDLIYGRGGDTDLRRDLATPKCGDGRFPAVVFLHGKGWRAGDRSEMDPLVKGIARLGYVGVTIEYRLVPLARFPAQVEDCKAAIRWMRAHA